MKTCACRISRLYTSSARDEPLRLRGPPPPSRAESWVAPAKASILKHFRPPTTPTNQECKRLRQESAAAVSISTYRTTCRPALSPFPDWEDFSGSSSLTHDGTMTKFKFEIVQIAVSAPRSTPTENRPSPAQTGWKETCAGQKSPAYTAAPRIWGFP